MAKVGEMNRKSIVVMSNMNDLGRILNLVSKGDTPRLLHAWCPQQKFSGHQKDSRW